MRLLSTTVDSYGISALYQVHAEELPEEIRIFGDLPTAKQWLGVVT